MIANIKSLEKYCTDYKNIENYDTAIKSPLRYDLHHRREISEHKSKKQLITENLYYGIPASDLIFLEQREHMRLHREGKHLSEETKKKLSDANKGEKCYMYGKPKSDETRRKMSNAKKGKHISAESRQKMSDAKKGKPKSAETKQKMSDANKGKLKGLHWHLENGHRIWTE